MARVLSGLVTCIQRAYDCSLDLSDVAVHRTDGVTSPKHLVCLWFVGHLLARHNLAAVCRHAGLHALHSFQFCNRPNLFCTLSCEAATSSEFKVDAEMNFRRVWNGRSQTLGPESQCRIVDSQDLQDPLDPVLLQSQDDNNPKDSPRLLQEFESSFLEAEPPHNLALPLRVTWPNKHVETSQCRCTVVFTSNRSRLATVVGQCRPKDAQATVTLWAASSVCLLYASFIYIYAFLSSAHQLASWLEQLQTPSRNLMHSTLQSREFAMVCKCHVRT